MTYKHLSEASHVIKKRYDREALPSIDTIMRRTNKNWEELLTGIGYDYRPIKISRLLQNLEN